MPSRVVVSSSQSRGDDAVPLRWQCPQAIQTKVYTAKSDVYSFGVLLWELFSGGATPFGDMTADVAFQAVCNGHRLPRPRATTPQAVVSLIREATAVEPQKRPTMAALRHALKLELGAAAGASVQGHASNPMVVLTGRSLAWNDDGADDMETSEL